MFQENVSSFINEFYCHIVLLSCSQMFFLIGRWATQGFDFLQAIEAAFISALPEDDFLVSYLVSVVIDKCRNGL